MTYWERRLAQHEAFITGETVAPTPARYEPRKLDEPQQGRGYAVYDTFTQTSVVGEAHPTWAAVVSACARLNRVYREAMS